MSRVPMDSKESLDKVYAGVKKVSDIVGTTMGAAGRHVFIQSEGGGIIVTKDGANTARMIQLPDNVENMGARMAIEAALKTADQAGDGTTSTIVILEALIRFAKSYIDNKSSNPVLLAGEIEAAAEAVIKVIEEKSIKLDINSTKTEDIARISANGDAEIAKLVVEAVRRVGENGNMSIVSSPTEKTYLDVVTGLRIESGYTNPYFANTPRRTCELVNPYIAITNEDFMPVDQIKDMCVAAIEDNRPLVIFGLDFTGEASASILLNLQEKRLSCVLIKAPSVGITQQEYMEDIAYVTGGKFISQQKGDDITKIRSDNWRELFGTCEKITVHSDRCVLAGGYAAPEDIDDYAAEIEAGLENEMNPALRARIEDRIRRLKSGVGIIYVGAQTDSELKERKDRIEDSILATQSAIKSGYQPGGGVAYIYPSSQISDISSGSLVVKLSILEPINTICRNAGIDNPMSILKNAPYGSGMDVRKGSDIIDMIESGVIDPTLVVVSAIRNAVKIATMIIKHGGSIYLKTEA